MKIHGYRQGQSGGGCLVTIVDEAGDERVLPMPQLSRNESRHSPDGYQWSYSGSGPTELARAILVAVIPGDDRVRHPRCYRRCRDHFLSGLKADEFEFDFKDVQAWYEAWLVENPAAVEIGWLEA